VEDRKTSSAIRLKLSFVIPLYNCLPLTQAMLASLRATLPSGLAYEIIFVDDGSTDGTREWLATLTDPPFRVVLNEKNLGYAGANNRGAALARGELLALLNNDLVLLPRWLELMLAAHRSLGPLAGLVGNVQITVADGTVDHAGVFISHKGKPEHDQARPIFSPWLRPIRRVAALTGACMLLSRALWEQLGGFDESYVNGCEDIDLCLRAAAAGRINAVALRSVVRHHVSSSRRRVSLRDEANARQLVLRWRETLVSLGTRSWCRHYLKRRFIEMRDYPNPALSWQALAYLARLRHAPPAGAVAGMQAAIEVELARWQTMFNVEPR
jgi:GT2 family glycosyltransferase